MHYQQEIAYTRAFVRSIGGDHSVASRRGIYLGPYDASAPKGSLRARLALVQWTDEPEPSAVLTANICGIKSAAFAD